MPVVNIEGIKPGQIQFTGPLLADIFLGKVKKWNDSAIAGLNPDREAARRSDHRRAPLGRLRHDLQLRRTISRRSAPNGAHRSAKAPRSNGRSASAARATRAWPRFVLQTNNSIGYVEYAYVLQNKMAYGLVQNKAGKFVKPDAASFQAAAASADWPKAQDFYLVMTDAPGEDAYPDRRHGVCPDAQRSRRMPARSKARSSFSAGRWRTARSRRATSTTFRFRPVSCSRSTATGSRSSRLRTDRTKLPLAVVLSRSNGPLLFPSPRPAPRSIRSRTRRRLSPWHHRHSTRRLRRAQGHRSSRIPLFRR